MRDDSFMMNIIRIMLKVAGRVFLVIKDYCAYLIKQYLKSGLFGTDIIFY